MLSKKKKKDWIFLAKHVRYVKIMEANKNHEPRTWRGQGEFHHFFYAYFFSFLFSLFVVVTEVPPFFRLFSEVQMFLQMIMKSFFSQIVG